MDFTGEEPDFLIANRLKLLLEQVSIMLLEKVMVSCFLKVLEVYSTIHHWTFDANLALVDIIIPCDPFVAKLPFFTRFLCVG